MWGSALKRKQGSEIPIPWNLGIHPMRGNLMVVMGSPGVGKSLFALNWCLTMEQPSLLLSLDTDMATQASRACSILAGVTQQQVSARPLAWAQYLDRKNLMCRMYDLNLGTQELNELVKAEEEYWGVAPGLVIVDNVSNVVKEMSYEAYRSSFLGLQKVARMRGCVVVALHHVKRDSSSGALSLHSGQYSGEQEAEVVLGLWRSGPVLQVGVLKNRNGPSDPSGYLSKPLTLSHQTLRMEEADVNTLPASVYGG